MLASPEPACLLIADISGYTSYLAGTELDHAQDILADLMTTVVGALRPRFRLAKLEGDAAFAYQLTERLDGSQLLDAVEKVYFAFRRRLRDIGQATSCQCNACALMPRLDLKVLVHHGVVIRHRVAGREELVGSDVIVAHRLLKNHVVEELGIPAYALFSEACIAAMSVDPAAIGMTAHTEEYEGLGVVTGYVHDLGAAWEAELVRRRRVVTEAEAGFVYEAVMPAPRDVVWSFVTDPTLRPRWQAGVEGVEELPTAPRRGVGSTNHCMHGADVIVEEILDWAPGEYVTHRTTLPDGFKAIDTFVFEEAPEGTKLRFLFTWGRNRAEQLAMASASDFLAGLMQHNETALRAVLTEEMARRAATTADAPPEPEAPPSLEREIREPVLR